MLTSADLTNRTFTSTREGYAIAEVDAFVVDVRETLALREQEVRELRQQLAAAGDVPGDGEGIRGSSMAAARLLEMATVNAEQLVGEAKEEAASLRVAANADAELVAAAAREQLERANAEVEGLRRLERRSREQLRGWFTELLAQVEDDAPESTAVVD